jgi:hypothetical protein
LLPRRGPELDDELWTGDGAGRLAGAAVLGPPWGDMDWPAAPPGCAFPIWLAMPPPMGRGPAPALAEPGSGFSRPIWPGGGLAPCQAPVAGVPGAAEAPPGVTACHPVGPGDAGAG